MFSQRHIYDWSVNMIKHLKRPAVDQFVCVAGKDWPSQPAWPSATRTKFQSLKLQAGQGGQISDFLHCNITIITGIDS